MSTSNIIFYIVFGLIFIGLLLALFALSRNSEKQKSLGNESAKPVSSTLSIEQHRQIVKNIPQILFIVGGGNIFSFIFFSTSDLLALKAIIAIISGIIYIAFGFGVQRKSTLALMLALPIYSIERIYNLMSNATIKGWDWTSVISGCITFIIVVFLWLGLQSMQAIEKEDGTKN